MADNVINTGKIDLPGSFVSIVKDRAIDAGVLAKLSPEQPTIFGPVKGVTFSGVPRAKIVGEDEKKPSTGVSISGFTAQPIKVVTQQRVSDEFLWADNDYRIGVLQDLISPALGASIGRAVDLIAFHGVDPATGSPATQVKTALDKTKNTVEATDSATADLIKAVGLIAAAGLQVPNGVALDPAFSFAVSTEVYPKGSPLAGQPMYPNAGLSGLDSWRGLQVGASSTVSGAPEIANGGSGVLAIAGDFSAVHWGFQRNFPIEIIEYGDPDQTGRDLKGHNEVMVRAEAVLYVAIESLDSFAVVKKKAAPKPPAPKPDPNPPAGN